MKVLVTGATGFLGLRLCAELKTRGDEVVEVGSRAADLREARSLEKFDSLRFDRIFHLAAWTQAGDFCLHHPGEQWIVNQQINTNVLAWWQRCQPQAKMIAIGTSCAYPTDKELAEENYLVGLPIESLFTYAMTKRMLYVGLLALHKQYGLNFCNFVPSTLYGPNYHHTDDRQPHFIFDLIRKIIRGKLYGDPVVLWGDGHQKRELVYVDDFVRLALELEDKVINETINIGAGVEYSIRHFAQLICDNLGYDFAKIRFDTTRHVGATSKLLDVSKLRKLLGNVQMTPLKQGLSETIRWMLTREEPAAERSQ